MKKRLLVAAAVVLLCAVGIFVLLTQKNDVQAVGAAAVKAGSTAAVKAGSTAERNEPLWLLPEITPNKPMSEGLKDLIDRIAGVLCSKRLLTAGCEGLELSGTAKSRIAAIEKKYAGLQHEYMLEKLRKQAENSHYPSVDDLDEYYVRDKRYSFLKEVMAEIPENQMHGFMCLQLRKAVIDRFHAAPGFAASSVVLNSPETNKLIDENAKEYFDELKRLDKMDSMGIPVITVLGRVYTDINRMFIEKDESIVHPASDDDMLEELEKSLRAAIFDERNSYMHYTASAEKVKKTIKEYKTYTIGLPPVWKQLELTPGEQKKIRETDAKYAVLLEESHGFRDDTVLKYAMEVRDSLGKSKRKPYTEALVRELVWQRLMASANVYVTRQPVTLGSEKQKQADEIIAAAAGDFFKVMQKINDMEKKHMEEVIKRSTSLVQPEDLVFGEKIRKLNPIYTAENKIKKLLSETEKAELHKNAEELSRAFTMFAREEWLLRYALNNVQGSGHQQAK